MSRRVLAWAAEKHAADVWKRYPRLDYTSSETLCEG